MEEVDVVRRGAATTAGTSRGEPLLLAADRLRPAGLTLPVATYVHTAGRCAITGGYVYRGRAVPALAGTYVFADYCTGEILGLRDGRQALLLDTGLR